MNALKGKTALVTGGSRGIGAAVARGLAAHGASVALTYARSEAEAQNVVASIRASGGSAQAIYADNRDASAVEAAVDAIAAQGGGVDILVNNAGILTLGTIDSLSLEDFDDTMQVNVRAAFVATRRAVERMSDGGRIISIGSNLAVRVPQPGLSLYSASKAALIGFTKGLARDLGARRITANIVHPGSTDTQMNPADSEMADMQRSAMAIPRYNQPDDVAGLVIWLAGPQARAVTGAEFTIDAGTNA